MPGGDRYRGRILLADLLISGNCLRNEVRRNGRILAGSCNRISCDRSFDSGGTGLAGGLCETLLF